MYYLYRHIRLDKNVPFYIGIATKYKKNTEYSRAYTKSSRNNIWNKIILKTAYRVDILYESINRDEILEKEKEFISLYGRIDLKTGSLSNLTSGGELNTNFSQETKDKISKRLTGLKRSEITKDKLRKIVTGTIKGPRTKEVKDLISIKNKGINNGMYGIHGINNKKTKTLHQYSLDDILIKTWINGRIAGEELKINYKDISACATGRQKTAHGFKWKY